MAKNRPVDERLRIIFLTGFRLITLFFPFADGAKSCARESEVFS